MLFALFELIKCTTYDILVSLFLVNENHSNYAARKLEKDDTQTQLFFFVSNKAQLDNKHLYS